MSSNNDAGEGVVVFGKNTASTQFLNLTQDGDDSYLANSKGLSEYFLKATNRDVWFGGNLTMPTGSTATVGQVSTTTHGTSADWHGAATTLTAKETDWDGTVTTLNNKEADWDGAVTTLNNQEGNWNDAYAERGSQIDGNGLTWDPSTKDLHIQIGNGLSFNASNELELDRLTITDLGNVGIGITTPDRTLSVDGVIRGSFDAAETEYLEIGHGGGNAFINMSGDGNMDFRYDNTNLITVRSNGELDLRNHDLENVDHGYFSSISSDALSFTTLPVGGTTADEVLVVAANGTVKSIASSELGGDSPWGTQGTGIGYTGTVDVDGTVITSSLQVTALPKANGYDRVLVEDGTGIIGYKDLSTFDLSPWTIDINDNLSYNTGNISTTKTMISDVATTEVAFIARGAGEDNFRVYGNGDIKARDLVLDQVSWPDYVFKDDYELKPIEEVEAFVKENKHLPDVPSEDEILENGMSVGEMNRVLLQKVEELTLYIIEQNKTIKQQKEDFAARLEALEQKIGQ